MGGNKMYVDIETTKSCNLRCTYCYFKEKDTENLTKERAYKIIEVIFRELEKMGDKELTIDFLGGEPLLNIKTIKYIIDNVNKKGTEKNIKISYDMTTNGTLFNRDTAEFCLNNKIQLKVSLDGEPYYHDLNRKTIHGNSSYNMLHKNLENFKYYQKKANKAVQVSMVVNKNTYKNFFNNFKYILNNGFYFIDSGLNYYENWNELELERLEQELFKALGYIFESAKHNKFYWWTFINSCLRSQCKPKKDYFCGAGDCKLYFTVEGDIYPCPLCKKEMMKIGKIDSGFDKDKRKYFISYERNFDKKCNSCIIKNTCASCDCVILNYEINNNLNIVPNACCNLSKVIYRISNRMMENSEWVSMLHKKMTVALKQKQLMN